MLSHAAALVALRTKLLTQSGIPAARQWVNENYDPVTGTTYLREEYLPGPVFEATIKGELEHRPQYIVTYFAPLNAGYAALTTLSENTLALFAPGLALTLSTGDVLRVSHVPAPYSGQILHTTDGWATVQVVIPLWARCANTI